MKIIRKHKNRRDEKVLAEIVTDKTFNDIHRCSTSILTSGQTQSGGDDVPWIGHIEVTLPSLEDPENVVIRFCLDPEEAWALGDRLAEIGKIHSIEVAKKNAAIELKKSRGY